MSTTLRSALAFLARPSHLTLLVATVVCAAAAVAGTTRLYDPDVWWVAAAGRELLTSGAIPRQNLFSFTEPSRTWIHHEWLLGPLYALGLEHCGPRFFVALTVFLFPAALSLVLAATLGRSRHFGAGLLTALVAIAFFGSRLLSARPSGVAQLFPLALALLAFSPRFGPVRALMVSALELIWANTHGSFPLGIALLTVAALDEKRDRPWRFGAVLTATLATFVNPYGLRLHEFVSDYALGRSPTHAAIHTHIYEFGNIVGAWGHTVTPRDLFGLALVTVLAAMAWRQRAYRLRASLCLVLIASAVMQARHIELAGLLTCLLLTDPVDEWARSWGLPNATSAGARRRASVFLVGLASLVGVGLFLRRGRPSSDGEWIAQGPDFCAALAKVPQGAHLYLPFSETGIGIWYGFPRDIRVFYDTRNDCYSARTIRAFFVLADPLTPSAQSRRLLKETGTNAVLVRFGHPLAAVLGQSSEWTRSHEEKSWRVYLRSPRVDRAGHRHAL